MEEFNASAGTQTGPEDRAATVSAALDAGRLGGVLLHLQRERFDGVLRIACNQQSAAIGFRDGTPVTFDDPTPGHTLAEQFVERGQLTREQGNRVLARMTDALVDDEAVAFCEHAVQLGYLTEDDAKVELSSRIRARMIQLFGWRECETSLMSGIAALLDRPEFPQNVGAVVYMGVRTFYDEEFLNSCHPDLSQTYVRLTAAPATIVHFFGLDDEEFQLLRRIQPDDPASLLVETRKVERVHLLALLLLLRMAQFCEVFNHAQPRATSPRMPHARAPREQSELGREDKSVARRAPGPPELGREEGSVARRPPSSSELGREDRSDARRAPTRDDGSVARRAPTRDEGSVARRPPTRDEGSVARRPPTRDEGSVARRPPTRDEGSVARRPPTHDDGSVARRAPTPSAHTREERPFARNGEPTPGQRAGNEGLFFTGEAQPDHQELFARSREVPPEPPPREDRSSAHRAPAPHEREVAQHQPPMAARSEQQAARGHLLDPPPPGRSARPTVDATQEALLEAAARTARMRRSLPARRNSKQADPLPGAEGGNVVAKAPEGPSATSKTGSFDASKSGPVESRPEYAKAHLKELIARHKHTASASESAVPGNQRDPVRELREARGLLHAQQYSRAEKALAALIELEPTNELYKTYGLWARWRAQPEAAESVINELQELAKKLVSNAEHGSFAAYVLGHVYLHNKRDDLAEKFFKRAHTADRNNKDAERHLIILERRKQTAADGGTGANRKLFGIQLPNKPKP
jgi:hypothetical protein